MRAAVEFKEAAYTVLEHSYNATHVAVDCDEPAASWLCSAEVTVTGGVPSMLFFAPRPTDETEYPHQSSPDTHQAGEAEVMEHQEYESDGQSPEDAASSLLSSPETDDQRMQQQQQEQHYQRADQAFVDDDETSPEAATLDNDGTAAIDQEHEDVTTALSANDAASPPPPPPPGDEDDTADADVTVEGAVDDASSRQPHQFHMPSVADLDAMSKAPEYTLWIKEQIDGWRPRESHEDDGHGDDNDAVDSGDAASAFDGSSEERDPPSRDGDEL